MRRIILITAAIAAHSIAAAAAASPNILLICVDDLKPMLGCYDDKTVQSPNIDRLAARGLRFDRAYCNQAVCAPSRNALLTGLRPQTLGIYDLATNFRLAAPSTVTLPQYFKSNGYRTEALGKIFHTGHGNHEDAASWSVPVWKSNVVHYALNQNGPRKLRSREAALFANVPSEKANKLPRGRAYESADVPDNTYPDGKLADEAIRRLENAVKTSDQPFFLAIGFVKPHLPFCAPKKYWDLYDRASFSLAAERQPPEDAPRFAATKWGELRNYAGIPERGPIPDELARTLVHGYHASVSYMDAQVGRVLAALDDSGLAENTIIVLWGDHGWHLGDHGMWCKHTNYEQATRIPLIVVDPRTHSGGGHTGALVESVDIYPTLCELAGLPIPSSLDGASFAAAIADHAAPTKDAIFHVFPRGKLLGRAVRTARYRLVEWKEPGALPDTSVLELYDFETDPRETKNIAADQPDIVRQLRGILDRQPDAKPQFNASKGADPPERIRRMQRRRRANASQ